MTSRLEPNPIAIHFSIEGRPGILRASNIIATFNLPMVLANSATYRQWPHPSPRKMVRLLSGDTTVGTIMFRRQLPSRMRLINHILRSNLFPLQHIVQRRGAILKALYRITEGFWFSPSELIMTSLFHFEDKVHRRSLPRAKSTPLLFPRLLCQVLEHIGFPEEPILERRRDCEAVLTIDRWHTMPRSYHLPPPDPTEDQPTVDIPPEDQPPTTEHITKPQAPASPAPATAAPVPPAPVPDVPPVPSTTMPAAHLDTVGLSTFVQPQQSITISSRDFLTILGAVHTFSSISTSFATAYAALADMMTRTQATMTQISAILAQNQTILMQIQSHLGLPVISPYVPAHAFSAHPPAKPAPPPPAPAPSLDVLAAAAIAVAPLVAPQPVQTEDTSSPTTD